MSGHGKKLQYDGSILEGTFLDSKLHGWASKKFIEGDTFEGVFNHDRREGYGEYLWSDGSQYHGMWSYDNAHGVGHMREETLSAGITMYILYSFVISFLSILIIIYLLSIL